MKHISTILAASALAAGLVIDNSADTLCGAKGDKAPAPAPAEREPVTARGADLLALVADAGGNGLMLTQEEGLDAVNAGFLAVDMSVTEGNTAKVTLTEAGRASLASSGNVSTGFQIEDNIAMPTNTTRRGRQGGYPFENLNIGQSFHVPVKDGEKPEDVAARLQSSVSGARARFAEEVAGETEPFVQKTYKKNEDGSFAKDADGKRIVETENTIQRPVTRLTRDFKVLPVTDDPRGPGARVWRVPLTDGGATAAD